MCMFCLNFSHINHQTSNVGIITPPQYVCPLYQNKPSLCHLLNPLFVCVSLSLSLCTLLLCPPSLKTMYCTRYAVCTSNTTYLPHRDMVWHYDTQITLSSLTFTPPHNHHVEAPTCILIWWHPQQRSILLQMRSACLSYICMVVEGRHKQTKLRNIFGCVMIKIEDCPYQRSVDYQFVRRKSRWMYCSNKTTIGV
jgi:hypothetical protein